MFYNHPVHWLYMYPGALYKLVGEKKNILHDGYTIAYFSCTLAVQLVTFSAYTDLIGVHQIYLAV